MQISLMHDLSIQQLQSGFASGIDGFFFGTYWYLNKPTAYPFVKEVAWKGGLKKALSIDERVIYIHGSDRPVESKSKDKRRMFLRPPLISLQEAVAFKPDVIQIMDLPLEDKDDEERICEKLAINHDMVVDYEDWLIKNGLRSSSRYKNGIRKFSRFMLLGVAHGDCPDAYAEEAKFMMGHCFPPFMEVLTEEEGYKPINQIKQGQMVWTHDNTLESVMHVMQRQFTGELVKLKVRHNGLPMFATEHPILSVKAKMCKAKRSCRPTMENYCKERNCTVISFEEREKRLETYKEAITLHKNGTSQILISKQLEIPDSTIHAWVNSIQTPKALRPFWKLYQPVWNDIDELEIGDFVTVPIPPTKLDTDYSHEEMGLFGLYIAEGFRLGGAKNKGIAFALGEHEDALIEECLQLIESVYDWEGCVQENSGHSVRVCLYKKGLSKDYACFGNSAPTKRIPQQFLMLPPFRLVPLIKMLWKGDGGVTTNNYGYTWFYYRTSSKTLAVQLFLILLKFGIVSSVQTGKQGKGAFGEGNDIYCVTATGINAQKLGQILGVKGRYNNDTFQHGFILGNHAYLPIKEKERILYKGIVYNLVVNNKQTYNCNGYPVHNCEIIGIPLAGLLNRIPKLSMPERYAYMRKVIENVLNAVGDTRIVQLMGYGVSRISELSGILALASKHDATLWFESSTIIRNSSHARKVLSLNPKNPDRLEYMNISRVKGAEGLSALDVFRQNDKILKNILTKATEEKKIG